MLDIRCLPTQLADAPHCNCWYNWAQLYAAAYAKGRPMIVDTAEILNAALKLPDADRLLVATRLMETLPTELSGLSEDDPGFLDELERRAADADPGVPVSKLWDPE
jgi:hypothetical protein